MKIPAKYKNKTVKSLRDIATTWFNRCIRERDTDKPCISCLEYKTLQAGHFYSGGKYSRLKFKADNVHGQCLQCNYYGGVDAGVLYRKNIIDRIETERVEYLDVLASNKTPYRWDRFELIEIILASQEVIKTQNFSLLKKCPFI